MENYLFTDCLIIPRPKMNSPQSPSTSPRMGNKFLQTLKNSPSLLRKKFMHSDGDLYGDGYPSKERCFSVHYGGRVPVKSLRVHDAVVAVDKMTPSGTASQQTHTQTAHASSCTLRIDKSTITFDDASRDVLESLPLFCIAYCATDLRHPRAIALTCKTLETIHCHVFEAATKEKASEVVGYIQRAFEAAWADWKRNHPDGEAPLETQMRHSPLGHVPL